MTAVLRVAIAVGAKDLRIEMRGRNLFGTVLPFSMTLLIAFGLAFGPGVTRLAAIAPGLLWVAIVFSAVLVIRRAYEIEGENDALETFVLAPVEKAALFLGKAGSTALQLIALEALLSVAAAVLLGLTPDAHMLFFVAALQLGTAGLVLMGTLFGLAAHSQRAREALFPLILFPLVTPVIVAAIEASQPGVAPSEATSWLLLLVAYDVVAAVLGCALFGFLLED
ncbi:MAG TPA: heme exporter protein CcmB [Actinomycetota bacterium]|nr:heme exporter protein CcmB [Actinomycetota bacterium]